MNKGVVIKKIVDPDVTVGYVLVKNANSDLSMVAKHADRCGMSNI